MARASVSEDWDEVLRWEGRIDELVTATGPDRKIAFQVLHGFALAYHQRKKFDKAGDLYVKGAEICGALKHFSTQVECLAMTGECFTAASDCKMAAFWFESARDLSAEQGFASMESDMCTRLGRALGTAARFDEGLEQHRRAMAMAQSVGEKRVALRFLVEALCPMPGHLEETDSMFIRLREGGDNSADCQLWHHYLHGAFQLCETNYDDASLSFGAAVDVVGKHPELLKVPTAKHALGNAERYLKECGVGASGAPPLVMVLGMVEQARESRDWPGVLRWESRLEELLTLHEASLPQLLFAFARANFDQGHLAKAASLFERRVQVLGKMKRFVEQGKDMCQVGECFLRLNDAKGAETWYQKARKFGEKHGCYSAECGP